MILYRFLELGSPTPTIHWPLLETALANGLHHICSMFLIKFPLKTKTISEISENTRTYPPKARFRSFEKHEHSTEARSDIPWWLTKAYRQTRKDPAGSTGCYDICQSKSKCRILEEQALQNNLLLIMVHDAHIVGLTETSGEQWNQGTSSLIQALLQIYLAARYGVNYQG